MKSGQLMDTEAHNTKDAHQIEPTAGRRRLA
jgi:hypothetical protein